MENYIKWKGGFAQNTPTTGTPKFEQALVSGKLVKEMKGYHYAKGGRGKQDIDCIYKGVNFKLELKVKTDEQKEAQIKYQKRVEQAGGYYFVIRIMDNLFAILDRIDSGESLKGLLFDK